jgi:hypothetical protein
MPVAVRFEFETEADAVAVVKKLEADERARATEIRLADGRTLIRVRQVSGGVGG